MAIRIKNTKLPNHHTHGNLHLDHGKILPDIAWDSPLEKNASRSWEFSSHRHRLHQHHRPSNDPNTTLVIIVITISQAETHPHHLRPKKWDSSIRRNSARKRPCSRRSDTACICAVRHRKGRSKPIWPCLIINAGVEEAEGFFDAGERKGDLLRRRFGFREIVVKVSSCFSETVEEKRSSSSLRKRCRWCR